jgi:hypothetical protein
MKLRLCFQVWGREGVEGFENKKAANGKKRGLWERAIHFSS